MFSFIKDGNDCWTVVLSGKSYTFNRSNKHYDKLVDLVKGGDRNDADAFISLMELGTTVQNWSEDEFVFKVGNLYYKKHQIHNVIAERILYMIEEGFNHKPMLRFLERLYKNPSYRAVNELYNFLEHKFLPITPDGYFLAYKAVSIYNGQDKQDKFGNLIKDGDLVDKYSNTIRNNVGDFVEMERFEVNDDCNVGCSYGLHVGSIDYVKSYGSCGDKVLICKVDPADVVSVPTDCSHKKVRTCRYEIISEYSCDLIDPVVAGYNDMDDLDEDEDDFCLLRGEDEEWDDDEYESLSEDDEDNEDDEAYQY